MVYIGPVGTLGISVISFEPDQDILCSHYIAWLLADIYADSRPSTVGFHPRCWNNCFNESTYPDLSRGLRIAIIIIP